jgi:hypothetical protein
MAVAHKSLGFSTLQSFEHGQVLSARFCRTCSCITRSISG